jgi:hypothetical protein
VPTVSAAGSASPGFEEQHLAGELCFIAAAAAGFNLVVSVAAAAGFAIAGCVSAAHLKMDATVEEGACGGGLSFAGGVGTSAERVG